MVLFSFPRNIFRHHFINSYRSSLLNYFVNHLKLASASQLQLRNYSLSNERSFQTWLTLKMFDSQSAFSIHKRLIKKISKDKFKNKNKATDEDESEPEDDDEFDTELVKDYTDVVIEVNSLRLDTIMKKGLSMSRAKVDTAFFESKIRLNELRLEKKSTELDIKDELDLIMNVNTENPELIDVTRLVLLKCSSIPDSDHLSVKLRRFKRLTIPNYDDPWIPSS